MKARVELRFYDTGKGKQPLHIHPDVVNYELGEVFYYKDFAFKVKDLVTDIKVINEAMLCVVSLYLEKVNRAT